MRRKGRQYNQTTMSLIRAVLFDYGMVLCSAPDSAAWESMKSLLHTDEKRFHAAYWRRRLDYDRGALNGPAFWHETARELGRSLSEDELAALLDLDVTLWTQPNQPMIDWVQALRRAGVRTGILSNIGDAMEEGILRQCPWMTEFDHHTFSHRLRIIKPDAAIYRHAVEGLDVAAEQVLFIDDREENIEGAKAAGMHAIQYTDHASFVKALRQGEFEGLPFPAEN